MAVKEPFTGQLISVSPLSEKYLAQRFGWEQDSYGHSLPRRAFDGQAPSCNGKQRAMGE